MFRLITISMAIFMTSCSPAKDEAPTTYHITLAKQGVENRLIDPKSAEYRDVKHNGRAVCGFVNSKNAIGGYTGFTAFVAGGDLVFFEDDLDSSEWLSTWQQLCQ